MSNDWHLDSRAQHRCTNVGRYLDFELLKSYVFFHSSWSDFWKLKATEKKR